jgi:flagellar motor protein MotB
LSRLKRRVQENFSQGSTWETVYMDLITQIMIFFLVLWALSAGKGNDESGNVIRNLADIPSNGMFEDGQSVLTSQGKKTLDKWLSSKPPVGYDDETGSRSLIIITGHTDDVGNRVSNLGLGYARARSAFKYFQNRRPKMGLLENVILSTASANEPAEDYKKLVAEWQSGSKSAQGLLKVVRAKNRRITIEIISQEAKDSLIEE